jgi:hypothetical protein
LLRWYRLRLRDYHRNSTACHGAFQKSSAIQYIVFHDSSFGEQRGGALAADTL